MLYVISADLSYFLAQAERHDPYKSVYDKLGHANEQSMAVTCSKEIRILGQ